MKLRVSVSSISLLILLLVLSGPGAGVSAAPFVSDDKPAVIVLHDSSKVGSVPSWVNGADVSALRGYVESKGGEFRLLDPDKQDEDTTALAAKWKAALSVKHDSLPWMAGAFKGRGVSEALPQKREDALGHVTPILGGS